jgi:uncharacterized protein (TIGR03000 family)
VSYGCCGGYAPPPPPPPSKGEELKKKPEQKKQDQDEVRSDTPATVVVTLPADAKLTIDGQVTRSTSARRVFVSPPLSPGKTYRYTLLAEVTRGGKAVSWEQTVKVRAGRESQVSMAPPTGVASR